MSDDSSQGRDDKTSLQWHFALIPLNMAIGSAGVLSTLVALSLGAKVADIGVMTAAGAVATIILSIGWGRLSDYSGTRKNYLLFLFAGLGPVFLALSIINSVPHLIVFYILINCFSSGISPIGVMYTVESLKGKNWQRNVARYNSMASVGNIVGLALNTAISQYLQTRWLFYTSSAMCFLAAYILWKTGQEPQITLERHHFSVRSFHEMEKLLSPRPVLHYVNLRRIGIPRNLTKLKPLHLLFLASFIHWTGILFFGVGQTPLMRDLNLSDSMILAVNATTSVASAAAFSWIAPHVKSNNRKWLRNVVSVRVGLIICWAVLPIFTLRPISSVYLFPLVFSIVFSIFYSLIWLPISTFAISQAPPGHSGSVQGELQSAIGVGNAIGSYVGGLTITAIGYSAGFIIAAAIAALAIPVLAKIDMT